MKQINNINKDKVLEDCYKFFATKDGADILPYSYVKSPSAYDDLIKNCKDYYLFRDEVELLKNNSSGLREYLKDIENIIEIGPGSECSVLHKTLPMISYAANLKNYYPLDISVEYLKDVCRIVDQSVPNIRIRPVEFDMIKSFALSLKTYNFHGKKKACVFLGGTLGNFNEDQQKSILQGIYNILESGDIFLITFDTNQNESEMVKAYSNKELFEILSSGIGYFCSSYPAIEQHITKLQPQTRYDVISRCISIFFIATSGFSLELPYHGTINIDKGRELKGIRSQKYTEEGAKKLLNNNFRVLDVLNNSNRMRIFVCQKL